MVYLFKTYVDYNEVKVLLNENKVKMMTKMAIYEKNEGRRMLRTAKYFKGDYVAFGILKTLITTTFAFAIVAISTAIADFFAGLIPTSNFGLALLNGLLGNKYLIMPTLTMLLATIKPEFMGNIGGAQEIGTFLIHIFFAVIGVPASIYLIVTQAPLLLVFCAIIVWYEHDRLLCIW